MLSSRLNAVYKMIEKCNCLADIGTDHGYIPIEAVKNKLTDKAIASDIKIGPIEVAKRNIEKYGFLNKIDLRVGPGLSTLSNKEADVVVIAGMGGNLIADIIKNDIDIAQNCKYLILQPVQYPEVLRHELEKMNFYIFDENIVKEDDKFYHILKVRFGDINLYKSNAEYYIGKINIKNNSPILLEYINHKIEHFNKIINQLDSSLHTEKFNELKTLIYEFNEVKKCLLG